MSLYLGENCISAGGSSAFRNNNIGEIIQSTIPLTDAGLHLLDGSLISGSGAYSAFVNYMANLYSTATKVSNIKTVGTLTDNNGVISGFSANNYATIGTVSLGNNFELCFKFTTGAIDSVDHQVLSGLTDRYIAISIGSNNELAVNVGNGSSWLNPTMTDTSVSANTTYWMKVIFDGSRHSIQKSTDGETFNEVGYLVSSTAIPSCTLNIGISRALANAWNGSIDLNECYININGSRWWTGRTPECFTDEAQWQSSVTTYGVCGKFVYDSVNNTVRLPKYSDKIWSGLGTAGVKGNGMTLGLTDGTNNTGLYANVSSSPYLVQNNSGAYGSNVGLTFAGGALGNSKSLGITLDSSKSGVIADLSTITTELEGYWYIVIATSTKTQIEVDIDEIATDLNGKADVDLSNVLANIDYVVESQLPSAENNYTWYRKYKSGWVEQGGIQSGITSSYTTINLIKTYADINYFLSAQTNDVFSGSQMTVSNIISESSFQVKYSGSGTSKICWEAKGIGA